MSTSSHADSLNPLALAALDRAWQGDVNGAYADMSAANVASSGARNALQTAVVDALSAGVSMFAGRYEDGLAKSLPALDVLEQHQLGDRVDWLYSAIGYSLGNLGDPERGMEWALRALAMTEDRPSSPGRRKAFSTQGSLLGLMRQFEPALAALRNALQIAEAQAVPRAIALCHANIASALIEWVRSLRDEAPASRTNALALEALQAVETALTIDAEDGPAQTRLAAGIYRGEALSLLARHRQAREALSALLPLATGNEHRRAELLLALAKVCLADGDTAAARSHLRDVEQLAGQQGFEVLLLQVLPTAVELEIMAGNVHAALACSQRHAALLEQHYRHRVLAATRTAELFAEAERLRRESRAWEDAALRDTLTGTLNRRGLSRQAEHVMRSHTPMAVAALDADHFKQVNDQHGHAVGDAVLCQLSQLIGMHSRAGDSLARIGGEEFILLLPGADADSAHRTCERMRQAIEQFPWATLAPGLAVTVSIGLACRSGETQLETLIKRADEALYRAKHAGRNRVCMI